MNLYLVKLKSLMTCKAVTCCLLLFQFSLRHHLALSVKDNMFICYLYFMITKNCSLRLV